MAKRAVRIGINDGPGTGMDLGGCALPANRSARGAMLGALEALVGSAQPDAAARGHGTGPPMGSLRMSAPP